MRLLVCGGRDFADFRLFKSAIDNVISEYEWPGVIISGMAPGADTMAADWARDRAITLDSFPADWERYGKRAGPIRNQQMIDEGKPDLVLVFPGGRGTADMIKRARTAGINVVEAQP